MTVFNKNITPERAALLKTVPFVKAEDIADGIVYALSTPEHVQVNQLQEVFEFFTTFIILGSRTYDQTTVSTRLKF